MSTEPFVSCICVTGKSQRHVHEFLPVAVRCFREQAYPASRRELIVLTDLEDFQPIHRVLAEQLVDQDGRCLSYPDATLGELRNFGLAAARGDYLLQWDDDDHHHPDRVGLQVETCLQHPGLPSFLQRQLCYDWTSDTAFVREYTQSFIHGTICHPRTGARYPAEPRREDTAFVAAWPKRLVIDNDPAIYTRMFHGGNTWDRRHVLLSYHGDWARGGWHLSDRLRAHLASVLAQYRGSSGVEHSPQ